jgi:hypothetical protein
VDDLDLTDDELQQILAVCRAVRIPDCPKEYIQDFLALRLDPVAPELAVKVRRYDAGQVLRLCELIAQHQMTTDDASPSGNGTNGSHP